MMNALKTHALLLLAAFLGAAACAPLTTTPESIVDTRDRFPAQVAPHMQVLHVPYAGGAITSDMDNQLGAFARNYLDQGVGVISISGPQGMGAEGYFTDRLIRMGVPRESIRAGAPLGPAEAAVEITYISYVASIPSCGDWSKNYAETADNKDTPNFGCATSRNIAAQVADPRDLITPTTMDTSDTSRRMTVVDKYRKGDTTGATKTQEQSAAVADVNR